MTCRPSYAYDADDSPVRRDQAGRDIAMLNYVLLALGFLTLVTAPLAVLLAYAGRGRAQGVARSHLDWQIRIFWHCILAWLAIGVLHAVIGVLGALTFGVGLVFLVVPWALGLAWLVWTLWAIAKGLLLLSRHLPIR